MTPVPRYILALMLLLLIGGFTGASKTIAAEAPGYLVESITLEQQKGSLLLRISGNGAPTFTSYQLFDPTRVVVDIADAALAEHFSESVELPTGILTGLNKRHLKSQNIVRIEALLTDTPEYLTTADSHEILLTMTTPPGKGIGKILANGRAKQKITPYMKEKREATAAILADLKKTPPPLGLEESVVPHIPPLEHHISTRKKTESSPVASTDHHPEPTADDQISPVALLGMDDYPSQKISVEFFRTDLHNVFRFFANATQRNVVVDEGVQGNLTLTLKEVPWDFALDIILNLKGLQKEERYNTIVISTQAKDFTWPERTEDRLRISADGTPERLERIAVRKRLELPKEQVRARKFLLEALELDQKGNMRAAINAYEKALGMWPDNVRLAERIATIYLMELGNNARALHFALTALRYDDNQDRSALIAAIAAANMQRDAEAKAYFDQAISQPQPSAEALLSYAAFAEEHDSPNGALALLKRHRKLFGDNLDSMVAIARLLDRIGADRQAMKEYRAILFSGYTLPEDLQLYIQERIAVTGE